MNVSVVIPLYNKEKRIKVSIESVLSQQSADFEVLVVDDGSTDTSAEIVKSISDSRLRYLYKENGGPSSARNLGVKLANYEWIVFLDADDELLPGSLKLFCDTASQNPGIEMFNANFFLNRQGKMRLSSKLRRNRVLSNNFRAWFFNTMMPCQGSTMYKKSLLESHPYRQDIRRYEDACMLFDIMRAHKIYTLTTPTFVYELDSAAASKGRRDIKEDFLGYLDLSGKCIWERMVLIDLYNQAKVLYPDQIKKVYPAGFISFSDRSFYAIALIVRRLFNVIQKVI